MLILGIDPGLAKVGYGLINCKEKSKEIIDCGIIKTNKDQSDGDRMIEIARDLRYIIRKWEPSLASVEKFFFYRSSATISVLQARGVIMMTLARFNIPVLEFPPMQIKLAVTGFGHAKKDEVVASVIRELELKKPPKPDDAADALAIALTAFYNYGDFND
ncbi:MULTISPECIES: crossover junction endodeoxyribonuclease RuvC [Prochlorococcus]|uniref:crossover junction endodeoxyribonuclease RuvC n=1 Tax=Prochlorococcus TaxID=1218 RepID=UPI000533A4E9|nr:MULTISPECIES: crossover junction endodeoxyribonuclease RuvC [Prochlorococcus]KGG12213.1 Crossover junction endodeoxyribonuclease RuvC [Prochlorococcus sp. MIT 0601]